MSRRMSCSMTVDAVCARTKTVTRRHPDTWATLTPGDRLTLIEKGMGLPKGAKQVVLAEVEVVSNRVERLGLVDEFEVHAEGLAPMAPTAFMRLWADSHGYRTTTGLVDLEQVDCRRIEWRYLDDQNAAIARISFTYGGAPFAPGDVVPAHIANTLRQYGGLYLVPSDSTETQN